jgi:hypothetical protein
MFEPIALSLRKRSRTLWVLYLVAFVAFLAMFTTLSTFSVVEILHGAFQYARGDSHPWSQWTAEHGNSYVSQVDSVWQRVLAVGGYILAQALFVWGGGKVRVTRSPVQLRRVLVSILLFSIFLSLLCLGMFMSFCEFAGCMGGSYAAISPGTLDDINHTWMHPGWVILIGWGFWLAVSIGYLFTRSGRNETHHSYLSKMTGILLVGSWIEFLVALPIDLALRPQAKGCVCSTGSWVAILIALPTLFWAIGPGLILLYLRDSAQEKADPGRSRRILVKKTIR